jgi:hypothetical protein
MADGPTDGRHPVDPTAASLPIREGPVRFAVGSPYGLSSNSWRFWTTSSGDAYLLCRDNFKNTKFSLHASGRWRMAFTEEAVAADPALVPPGSDRAWEVWDEPPALVPQAVTAFRLIFSTDELTVRPEQRVGKVWRDTYFIEAAPPGSGKLTVVTLFVTEGEPALAHDSEPSFTLAVLPLNEQRMAQLIAHAEPIGAIPEMIDVSRQAVMAQAREANVEVPEEGYLYFFGNHADGARFITGARTHPT